MISWASRAQSAVIESMAVEQAESYSQAISTFRNIYTSEVTNRAKGKVLITHDYENFDNAIPLPATMSHLLGEKLTETTEGGKANLYSSFPFPWRTNQTQLDSFQQEALASLSENPTIPFHRIETINGQPVIRYATANIMQQGCVDCHNAHVDSPKSDWQVGDVRGALEVQLPLTAGFAQSRSAINNSVAVFGIVGILGALFTALVTHLGNKENENILRKARDTAEKATATRETFIAQVSHELRTPLSAILASARLLQMADFDKEKRDQKLQMIESGGSHILELLNDILDLSKIDAQKMSLDLEKINIRSVCHDSLIIVNSIAKQKDIQLILQLDPQIEHMVADKRRLRQILINLLSNAVKFTHTDGRVGIRTVLDPVAKVLDFQVWDSGIGMSKEDMEKIFTAYTQLDGSLEKSKGTGLGLVLVKQFTELHDGEVNVTSELGKGTQFTISLPIKDEAILLDVSLNQELISV